MCMLNVFYPVQQSECESIKWVRGVGRRYGVRRGAGGAAGRMQSEHLKEPHVQPGGRNTIRAQPLNEFYNCGPSAVACITGRR